MAFCGGHFDGSFTLEILFQVDSKMLRNMLTTILYITENTILILFEILHYILPLIPSLQRHHRTKRRTGKWKDVTSVLDANVTFACDKRSHEVTNEHGKTRGWPGLTGESCGRQIWYEDRSSDFSKEARSFHPATNSNGSDKLFREYMVNKWQGVRPDENLHPSTATEALHKGMSFYQMLQCDDGHWAGDYGGPMFLLPGLVITLYVTGVPLEEWKKKAMIHYLKNHQQVDGGWGTHIEGPSTLFGSVLSYVTLRLLGTSGDEDCMKAAREFMHSHGGALYAPSWCKVRLIS